jgi:hypothetical protein
VVVVMKPQLDYTCVTFSEHFHAEWLHLA